jgi:hypothetical protein
MWASDEWTTMKDMREELRKIAADISAGGRVSQEHVDLLKQATGHAFVHREVIDIIDAVLRRIESSAHGASMLGGQERMLEALLGIRGLGLALRVGLAKPPASTSAD